MGMSVRASVFYGAQVHIHTLFDLQKSTVPAKCHPSRIQENDHFCPVCGNPAVTTTSTVALKSQYEKFFGTYHNTKIPTPEVFCEERGYHTGYGGEPLGIYYDCSSPDDVFIGQILVESGNLAWGDGRVPIQFDPSNVSREVQEALDELGLRGQHYLSTWPKGTWA